MAKEKPNVVGGHFWIDDNGLGTLAHLVQGPYDSSRAHRVERAVCGLTKSGATTLTIPPDRACPRCIDIVNQQRR